MSSWAGVAFWAGFAVIATGMIGGAFLSTRSDRRRAYWLCWLAGGTIMALAAGHDDLHRGLYIAGLCAAMSVVVAFFKSPHLKIGGTIYAASIDDRQPDPPEDPTQPNPPTPRPADSYGNLSAATFWWLNTALLGACGVVVALEGWDVRIGWAAAMFTLCVGLTGYRDAAGGFPRVRGQHVPAAVLAVTSIPLFLAPPLVYLISYEIGRQVHRSSTRIADSTTAAGDDLGRL